MSKTIFIKSNFGIENHKKPHPEVVYENNIYWWKAINKYGSQKYFCSLTCKFKFTAPDYVLSIKLKI